jgi:hypothetical protein
MYPMNMVHVWIEIDSSALISTKPTLWSFIELRRCDFDILKMVIDFVGLSFHTTEKSLSDAFSNYGQVVEGSFNIVVSKMH